MTLACVFLLAALFSASSACHQWLHKDAAHKDHQCAITLLEKQQVLSNDISPQSDIAEPNFTSGLLLAETISFFPPRDGNFQSRAPPFSRPV